MRTIDWYFDFISPFAYLQSAVLSRVEAHAKAHANPRVLRRRPILFAGLLSHWGQLGPAEIAPKREWTFRHCVWLAARHGIPMTMPTMHPFNPLPLLRLSIASSDTADVVDRLFRFVWVEGHVPTDAEAWSALLDELGVDEDALTSSSVKEALRNNGNDALRAGVFGVPTAVVDGETFWGFEATDMLLDYLDDATMFTSEAMVAASRMPMGPSRARTERVAS